MVSGFCIVQISFIIPFIAGELLPNSVVRITERGRALRRGDLFAKGHVVVTGDDGAVLVGVYAGRAEVVGGEIVDFGVGRVGYDGRVFGDLLSGRVVNKDRVFARVGDVFLYPFPVSVVRIFANDAGNGVRAGAQGLDLDLFVLCVVSELSIRGVPGSIAARVVAPTGRGQPIVLWTDRRVCNRLICERSGHCRIRFVKTAVAVSIKGECLFPAFCQVARAI